MNNQDIPLLEIQSSFEQHIETWADIVLNLEVALDTRNQIPEQYSDDMLMNATIVLRHVMFNIGFHKNIINEDNAEAMGNELRDFILKYAGIDSRTFYTNNI